MWLSTIVAVVMVTIINGSSVHPQQTTPVKYTFVPWLKFSMRISVDILTDKHTRCRKQQWFFVMWQTKIKCTLVKNWTP